MSENFKNSYKATDKTIVALSVYNVGYQRCAPLYQWGPGIRDHYLIHYVVSGRGYYETGGKTYELNAGDVFLAYPDVPITYFADREQPWEYCWVGFNGSDAVTLLGATDFSKATPVIHGCAFGGELKEALSLIYQCRGSSFFNAVEMTGRLYQTLALFIRENSASRESDVQKNYVRKAIEYINGHYAYPISVEDIAAYAGISRSQLYRSFRDHLRQSPKEYLSAFRIRQACQLLAGTDLPINTVARSAGFENSLYFSKVFRKICGESPSSYRAKKAAGR